MATNVEQGRRSPWLALGRENYRLYFSAQLISETGRWLQNVGQAWLVLDLTGSPLALGTISIAAQGPSLAFSVFAGVLADRLPKRRLLMAVQAAALLQSLLLMTLVLTGQIQLWQIYVLAAIGGTLNAIDNPTRQAFASELVGPAEIQSAVGLSSSVVNGTRIIGPAIGGVIIATWGTGLCFAINALTFVVALGLFAAMRADRLRPAAIAAAGRLSTQIADGMRYVARDRELVALLALYGLMGTLGYNFSVAIPLLARYTFDAGPTGYGGLNAAMGLGSLIGGLLVASRAPSNALRLSGVAVVFSLALMCVAVAPVYPIAALALVGTGTLGVFFSAGANTSVQLRAKPEFRGRVLSLFFLAWAGGTPIGHTFTGFLSTTWTIQTALAVNASVCLLGAVGTILYIRRLRALAAAVPKTAGA